MDYSVLKDDSHCRMMVDLRLHMEMFERKRDVL
jgi:hypothetical protein